MANRSFARGISAQPRTGIALRTVLPHGRSSSRSIVAQRSGRAPVEVQQSAEALVAEDSAGRRLRLGLDRRGGPGVEDSTAPPRTAAPGWGPFAMRPAGR